MSLIYKRTANQLSPLDTFRDYWGEIIPFAKRIDRKLLIAPLVIFKSIEWGIYRWYKTPIRRFYGVRGNELIYMITRHCTDKCAKCGIWKAPESEDEHIPVSCFIDCMNRLQDNLYQVTLTGGEPLVFKNDILLIAREAAKQKVPMVTVTNGVLIDKAFLEEYGKLGHILVISLDTLDMDKWLSFRGQDHYETVIQNIRLAIEILGKQLKIQSVLSDESRDDILKVKAFCDEHSISHVIQPYMDFGGYWHSTAPYNAETGEACAARKNICIYPNGDVVKCFDHYRIPLAREPLGNIAREDIVAILCKKRSTEVSRMMKGCNLPCKQLSCNVPQVVYNP